MRQGKYPQSLVAVLARQFSVKRGPADAQRFCGLRHIAFGLGNGFVDHGELELLQCACGGRLCRVVAGMLQNALHLQMQSRPQRHFHGLGMVGCIKQ